MNPIRRIYTFFHKNLLTKTMAIGVVLALMGTTCLIQLANIQLVNGKGWRRPRRKAAPPP